MFVWNVEEMKLMNENYKYIGKEKIYKAEDETSREDKLAFVDSMQNGKLSYILSFINKFNKEKDSLPKDRYGYVKTVSLKAWLKRNDTGYDNPVFDNWYHYGSYSLLGSMRSLNNLYNNKGTYDFYEDFVDECFHRQLKECERLEKKYFQEHDEYYILKSKLINQMNNFYTTFNVEISYSSNNDIHINDKKSGKHREITIEEIKELLDKYDKINKYIKELTEEIHIKY